MYHTSICLFKYFSWASEYSYQYDLILLIFYTYLWLDIWMVVLMLNELYILCYFVSFKSLIRCGSCLRLVCLLLKFGLNMTIASFFIRASRALSSHPFCSNFLLHQMIHCNNCCNCIRYFKSAKYLQGLILLPYRSNDAIIYMHVLY